MTGIYKIENLLTGEVYIGQSRNIEKRIKEHYYHTESYIDFMMHNIGIENFGISIIELCDENISNLELDKKEDKYIIEYHSNEYGFGYNLNRGGQYSKYGELNNNAKLNDNDVYEIRESYKNHEYKRKVYDKYKDKITEYTFSNLWEGKYWTHIHMDVYTPENIDYYKHGTSIGENAYSACFTNEEVLNLRKQYVNKSAKEIYESVKDKCKFQTLQCILWGRYYSEIPIYNKREKRWIN